MRTVLAGLPSPDAVLAALDVADQKLAQSDPDVTVAHELDRAMDQVQLAIADVDRAIHRRYVAAVL